MGRKDMGKEKSEKRDFPLILWKGLWLLTDLRKEPRCLSGALILKKAEGSQVTTICGCSFAIYSSAILLMSTRWRCPQQYRRTSKHSSLQTEQLHLDIYLPSSRTPHSNASDHRQGKGAGVLSCTTQASPQSFHAHNSAIPGRALLTKYKTTEGSNFYKKGKGMKTQRHTQPRTHHITF